MHRVVNDLKLRISKSLKDRFKDVNTKPNLMIATLLDPRFKEIPFEQYDLDLDQAVEYAKADALKEILSHEENDSTEDEDSILDAKEYIPDKMSCHRHNLPRFTSSLKKLNRKVQRLYNVQKRSGLECDKLLPFTLSAFSTTRSGMTGIAESLYLCISKQTEPRHT